MRLSTFRFKIVAVSLGALGLGALSACSSSGGPSSTTTAAGPPGIIPIATFNNNANETTPAFHVDTSQWLVEYTATSPNCSQANLQVEVYNSSNPGAFIRQTQFMGCTGNAVEVKDGPGNFFLKLVATTEIFTVQVVEQRK